MTDKMTWTPEDVTVVPTRCFGVTENGLPAWFDANGVPHLSNTVTFGIAHQGLLDRLEDNEATDEDFAAIAAVFPLLWETDEDDL